MKRQNDLQLILAITAAALLAACAPVKEAKETSPPVVTGVSVVTVHSQSTTEYYEAVGTIKPEITSVLGAEISGTVRKISVKEGDRVRRGQVLAVIDSRAQQAQLEAASAGIEESDQGLEEVRQALQAAEADRKFAEATFQRYKALLAKTSVSQQEYDNAETRYKGAIANEMAAQAKLKQMEARQRQAQAQHSSAATMLSYSRIVSPIDGVVTAKSVDEGTLVMPGTPLITVEQTGNFRLDAGLPERFLGLVHVGESVPATLGPQQVEGRVVEVVPAADPSTRTFVARVLLPRECKCQSGQYGSAKFAIGAGDRLLVPSNALVQRGELEGLFVVDSKGVAYYRLVKTGKTFGSQIEILSGLDDGERVAVSKIGQLSDGIRVQTS
ncbi:MAG: efflux RND transporter periplasmic adaptor subunit [Acidobacteria bacterium]|nr:MAG: efflux RND transporter periplasmic adaptor subunit [Acidobacteriota bacterium]